MQSDGSLASGGFLSLGSRTQQLSAGHIAFRDSGLDHSAVRHMARRSGAQRHLPDPNAWEGQP